MKQKRKGASLFSSKKRLEIVSLLGILGGVLCIASVGLLNKSAMAAAGDTTTMKLDYTGIGDDTEVVYNVSFVSETDNSKDLLNIYKKDSNLYITPNNVVVNPSTAGVISRFNKVEGGVYGHVLGGNGNRISSANVTIIAGESNVVNSNNANATILGGKQNVLYAGSGSRVAVLVGGYNNRVYNSNNPVNIIGGRNNEISDAASNATILGGSGNVVGGANAIVGGLGVGVPTGVEDVFVFSERGLGLSTSDSSEAFYLDVLHGLGINVDDSTTNGVEVGGAMGFGEIDINNECGESNYGLQGTWTGCLVGCTTKGWELLDTSEYCKLACAANNNCIDKDAVIPTPTTGFCEGNLVVDEARMHRCTNLHPENYYDTTFEKVVIDSDKACPTGDRDPEFGNNQCVYQCNKDGNSEFHLIENKINMPSKGLVSGDKGCYQSCKRDGKQINHGQTEVWYSENPVSCAYPDNDDTMDPKSVYTCGLYKATLMCVDGELYTVRDEGGDLVPDQKDNEHVYSSCDLYSYECSSDYTLSADDITSGPFEDVLNTVNDRGTSYGNRGKYKLCISYDAIPNEACDARDWRYEVKCNSGTTAEETFEGSGKYKCAYMCTDRYGNKVPHGTQTGAYKSQSVQCEWEVPNPNNRCEGVTVQCVDGRWYELGENGSVTSTENQNWTCSTRSNIRCDGYGVKQGNYETLIKQIDSTQESFYSSCGWNKGNGLECEGTTSFKFDGCGDGYKPTTTDLPGMRGVKMDVCEKIPTCGTSKSGEECNDSNLKGAVKQKVVNGLTGHQWQCEGTYGLTTIDCEEFFKCNNAAPSGDGVILTQKYPTTTGEQKNWSYSSSSQSNLKACEYTCAEGYHDNGNGCSANQCKGSNPTGTKVNSDKRPAEHDSVEWTCDATSTDACTYSCEGTNVCNSDKTGCESGEKDCILPKPTGSAYKLGYGKYTEGYTPNKWTYTSSSDPLACEYTCKSGYVWSGGICTGATIPTDYECSVGSADPSGVGYIASTKKPTTDGLVWGLAAPGTTSGTVNNKPCQYICNTCYESSNGGRCIGKEVKVKYVCEGSGNVVEETGRYTQYELSYSACKKDGFEVIGWSKTKGGNTDYMPGSSYPSCEGTTLYPVYRARQTVSCTVGSADPSGAGYIASTKTPTSSTSSSDLVWHLAAAGTTSGTVNNKPCQYICNTCYESSNGGRCIGKEVKVKYVCEGSGNVVEETGRYTQYELSYSACKKDGFEVIGWSKTKGGNTDYMPGSSYPSCEGTTLYPVYRARQTVSCTVGSADPSGAGYIASTKTPTSSTSSSDLVWHLAAAGTTSGTVNNKPCQYICNTCYESSNGGRCIGKEVKVKYVCEGSGNVVEETGRYTQYELSYSACKKDGFEVIGWSKTKGGNTDYMPGSSYPSCEGTTLYPVYRARQTVSCTVGSADPSGAGYIASTKTPTSSTSSSDLVWHLAAAGTTSATVNNKPCQYICNTCYESSNGGRCIGKEVKVKYVCEGSGNVVEETGRYTQYELSYSACKKDGFEVIGWSKTRGGNTDYMPGSSYPSCEGTTLYPVYRARQTVSCTVGSADPSGAGYIASTKTPTSSTSSSDLVWHLAAAGTTSGTVNNKPCQYICNTCYESSNGGRCIGKEVKVKYVCEGSGNVVEETGRYTQYELSYSACKKDGFEVIGWSKTRGGNTDYMPGSSYPSCEGTTLYPVYRARQTVSCTVGSADPSGAGYIASTKTPTSSTSSSDLVWHLAAAGTTSATVNNKPCQYICNTCYESSNGGRCIGKEVKVKYACEGSGNVVEETGRYTQYELSYSACKKDGFEVIGWSKTRGGNTDYMPGSSYPSCEGTTLYPVYRARQTVSCRIESVDPENWVGYIASTKKPTESTSYSDLGWHWAAAGTTSVTVHNKPCQYICDTCYMGGEGGRCVGQTFKVTYDCGGGNKVTQDLQYGKIATTTLSSDACTETNYELMGWSKTQGSSSRDYDKGGVYDSCAGTILYPVYRYRPTCWYAIAYDANGGTPTPSSESVVCQSSMTLASAPTKANYTFDGWWTQKIGGVKRGNAGASYTPSGDETLYAHWVYDPCTYTVTYDANGGTVSLSSDSVLCGSSATLPDATKTDYDFNGWYTSKDWGTKVGDAGVDYTPSGDVTLYAHWTKISYTCAKTLTNKYKCVNGSSYIDGTSTGYANSEYTWFCNGGSTKCGICDDGTIPNAPHKGECKKSKSFKVYHYIPYLNSNGDQNAGSNWDLNQTDDKSGEFGDINVSNYKKQWTNGLSYYGYQINGITQNQNGNHTINTTSSTFKLDDSLDHIILYYKCESGKTFDGSKCVTADPCADYPLTSCNFPGAVHCSTCPSDSSKMKLEVCAPTYDSFAPHYDERGVTYWIKTDGTCPEGAICAPANITWYTKNGNTCVPNEHNNKIIGCQDCYRKAYMGPECVYDASYCTSTAYTLTLDPNRSGCNSATYTLSAGEQFKDKLIPPSGSSCSSQYWDGWYTEKNGGTKYQGGDTMPASDLTLYAHWRSTSSNGSCHTSTVGHPCIEAYYNGSPNTSWTNYVQQTSTNGWASYCSSKTSETSCIDAGATLMTQYGNYYNGWNNTTKYKAISNYSTYQTTNSANVTETKYRCCEWSGPSS